MSAKGIYLSIEATLSLLLLLAVVISEREAQEPSTQELYIFQKENDLLKLWAKKGMPPIEEMASDFEFAFPGKSGEIGLDGELLKIGKLEYGSGAISSEIEFFNSKLGKKRVRLRVFK